MAAVLLRRVFLQLEYKELVEELPMQVISSCQDQLLVALQMETNASIRRKICDAVAELARSCLGERGVVEGVGRVLVDKWGFVEGNIWSYGVY